MRTPYPSAWVFQVAALGSYYGLHANGEAFGVFSKKLCSVIQELLSVGGVRLSAYAEATTLARVFTSHTTQKPASLSVDLNVYGKREAAAQVGAVLSSSKTYLQQPLFGLEQALYYNPHFLHMQELSGQYVTQTPLIPTHTEYGLEQHGQTSQTTTSQPQIDANKEISHVMNTLSHTTLQQVVADKCVKATLRT
jgi:hypothetical protein